MHSAKTITILISVATFFFGILLGPGALWQWHMEEKKYDLETSKHIIELRREANDLFLEIYGLFREYVPTNNDLQSMMHAYGFGLKSVTLTDQKIKDKYKMYEKLREKRRDLKTKLDYLITDYNAIEIKLATHEKRKSRELPVDFIPPSPPAG